MSLVDEVVGILLTPSLLGRVVGTTDNPSSVSFEAKMKGDTDDPALLPLGDVVGVPDITNVVASTLETVVEVVSSFEPVVDCVTAFSVSLAVVGKVVAESD